MVRTMNSLPPDDKSCDAEEKENATHYTLPFIVRLIQLCVRLVEFYPINCIKKEEETIRISMMILDGLLKLIFGRTVVLLNKNYPSVYL